MRLPRDQQRILEQLGLRVVKLTPRKSSHFSVTVVDRQGNSADVITSINTVERRSMLNWKADVRKWTKARGLILKDD